MLANIQRKKILDTFLVHTRSIKVANLEIDVKTEDISVEILVVRQKDMYD